VDTDSKTNNITARQKYKYTIPWDYVPQSLKKTILTCFVKTTKSNTCFIQISDEVEEIKPQTTMYMYQFIDKLKTFSNFLTFKFLREIEIGIQCLNAL